MRRDHSTPSRKKVELRRVLNEMRGESGTKEDEFTYSTGSKHQYDASVRLQLESPLKRA
jgi:hypothetical protein